MVTLLTSSKIDARISKLFEVSYIPEMNLYVDVL